MVDTSVKDIHLSNIERSWVQRVAKEDRATTDFEAKWGWMIKYYEDQELALQNLKRMAKNQMNSQKYSTKGPELQSSNESTIAALPKFPVTSAQEIGWLAKDPAFALETLGPYPNTRPARIPVTPPGLPPLSDIDFYVNDY